MRYVPATALVFFTITLFSGSSAFGQDALTRALKGIDGLHVAVGQLDDETKALGLDTETIQTDVDASPGIRQNPCFDCIRMRP